MKLHLPIALLTAVVSAMSYAHADINRELSGTPVTGATQGDLTVTITGNDDYTTTNMYYNKKPGYIGGAAHYEASGKENTLDPANGGNPADRYSSLNMIVGGEGSDPTLKYLMLEGLTVNSVVGDKSVTVNSGTIEILYGGIVYLSGVPSGNLVHTGNVIGPNYYPCKDSSNPANTSITINGGTVGHIRGGHSGKQAQYVYQVLSDAQTYDKEHGTNTYGELMADKPWSISGDVNIAVNGGVIDAASAGKTTAIMGAGGSGHSVDGTVKVSVSGGTVLGDIFAGSNNIYSEVGATHVEISGGAITGNVYGGGDIDDGRTTYASYTDAPAPTVKGDTTVVLSGGTITGDVYAAGINDKVIGGTNVVIKNGGTKVTGTISGMGVGVDSVVEGDRLLTIENSGGLNVGWNQFEGFNSLKIDSSQINFGTLSDQFKTVTTTGTGTHVQGTIAHDVLLKSDGSWLQLDGSLSTTAGSYITNTMADHNMSVKENATFAGTSIGNSIINVGKAVTIKENSNVTGSTLTAGTDVNVSGSTVTDSNLVAANGNVTFNNSSMNGGEITLDGTLHISTSQVKVDKINGGEEIVVNLHGTPFVGGASLEVNQDIKLAVGSQILGWDGCYSGQQIGDPYTSYLTAKSITAEKNIWEAGDDFLYANLTATEGNIEIGGGNRVVKSNLVAKDSVILKDGASLTPGSTATAQTGDVVLQNASAADSTLTAGENVTISESTVSGSKVTATAGDLTVAGSTVSDTDLYATNGTVSISGSKYNNDVKGLNYIEGDTVKIANTEISNTKGALVIKGDTYVTNGDFVVTGASDGAIRFSGDSERVFDTDSSFTIETGYVRFGAENTESGVVISNGAEFTTNGLLGSLQMYSDFIANNDTKITTEKGGMSFYGDVTANDTTSITAKGGNISFFGNVTANAGTTITATGGKSITFNEAVNLTGSTLETNHGTILFIGDVTAKNTTFLTNGDPSSVEHTILFGDGKTGAAGTIRLDGGNKLEAAEGTNAKFAFRGDAEVIVNGDHTAEGGNSISGNVTMADGTKLTAESGTLNITTRGDSSLNNVQQTGDAQINVTANGGSLNLKGTSKVESLTLNNTTSNNTGSLTSSTLVTNGGTITNTGSLTVKQTSQLTGTTLTNSGTASFKGAVTSADSKIVNNGGTITFSETVTATGGEYKADGGTIKFDNTTNALNAVGGTYTVDNGGIIRFGNTDRAGQGVVNAEGTAFVAEGGNMYFHSDVNANGTTFTTDGGYIRFQSDVVAENTTFVADGGGMYFNSADTIDNLDKNTVTLNGGNTFEAKGNSFTFEGIDFIAKGDNTFKGGFSMGDSGRTVYKRDENGNIIYSTGSRPRPQKEPVTVESSFIAQSGVQTIESDKYAISLNNIKIAEGAAEGTKINVTSNGVEVSVSGESSISNLTVNGAKGSIKGDVYIAEKLVVNNATSGSMTVTETGALTAENVEINGSSLVNEGTANLKNVALTDGSSVSNTGETLELGAATVSGSVSIKHNTDGTTKIGGITKTDDSAYVSLSQAGGTVEFNGGKGTVAEIDSYNSGVSDAAMVQSGDGTVNVGRVLSTYGTVEFKQTGNGEMNFGVAWINWDTNTEINQTGKGHINFRAGAANVGSVTQSGGGTFTYDAPSSRILSLDISNGSTFEAMCSVELDDVAISDATLFNAGTMTMDSLVMDNATLLFAASSLTDASSMIQFNGADLTGYGTNNVSAVDMIKEFGVVMSGADAAGLLQQWGSEVEFSFTLAKGSDLFEEHFAYVLDLNKDEFTITLGDVAELSFADGEIKNITVEDTENGVVVKGIAVIPEPTTATLSLLALAALAARRRRK